MKIEIQSVYKSFGVLPVLRGVSLEVQAGEMVALLGPSGCGKTTLLRIIAGLEFSDQGRILFDGKDVNGHSVRERQLGFVFQHHALFRHMTIYENVAFGLRVRSRQTRPPREEIQRRVMELLRLVKMETQAGYLPSELSGGQRQRVALARALTIEPTVLLLDEPFGSLDAQVRRELRRWVRQLHESLHLTSLFVTHDQEEALEIADRVAIMHAGEIVQIGTPEEVYQRPISTFVYSFLGNVNLFHGRVEGGHVMLGNISLDVDPTEYPDANLQRSSLLLDIVPPLLDGPVHIYVRPHMLEIVLEPGQPIFFSARVLEINPAGHLVKVKLLSEWGEPVAIEMPHESFRRFNIRLGQDVFVRGDRECFYVASVQEGRLTEPR